jgi:hypothetical protein
VTTVPTPSVRSPGPLTALRCRSQLLTGTPPTDAVDVVARLLAVQAQDPRGFRLAVRTRSTGVTAADVDRALTDDRSLIVTTLNRGTLHLVRPEDYWWLHPLITPSLLTSNTRRLAETGVSPDRAELGVRVVTDALRADGPLTRAQLRSRLDSSGVPTAGQALVHVLALTSLRGLTVRGPVVDGHQLWVPVADWLGSPPPFDRPTALAELARRYLAGHAPAGDRDLARWAGLPLRDARAGLSAIASELVEVDGGLVAPTAAPRTAEPPPPRLLGPFDPLLHGWVDRTPVVADQMDVITTNGLFRPFALVGGRAVATWGLAGGTLTLRPFAPLSAVVRKALDADAADVADYLGLVHPIEVVTGPPPA